MSNNCSQSGETDAMVLVDPMAKWAAKRYGGRKCDWIGPAWIAYYEARITHKPCGLSLKNWVWWRFKDLVTKEIANPKKPKIEEN